MEKNGEAKLIIKIKGKKNEYYKDKREKGVRKRVVEKKRNVTPY